MRVSNFKKSNCLAFTGSLPQLIFLLALIIGSVALLPTPGLAQGPENTVVVVNADSSDSLAIANLYVQLRDIPASNVIYLNGITHDEKLGDESGRSADFLNQIARPVMAAIKDRQLDRQITCITYSAGFPTRFNAKAQTDRFIEKRGLKYNKIWHAPWASITSLTYLYDDAFSSNPQYFLDPNANRYASQSSGSWLKNPFVGELAKQFDLANELTIQGDFVAAAKIFTELQSSQPRQMAVIFANARSAAIQGNHDSALKRLADTASKGFHWGSSIQQDPAFVTLRSNSEFKEITATMGSSSESLIPSRNFSAGDYWASNGWPNATSDQGRRYYLSTVLAVVGDKERSSLDSALEQINRSCAADGTHPKAAVYLSKHGNVRSRTRSSQFAAIAAELKALGGKPVIGGALMMPQRTAVVGATLGNSIIDLKKYHGQFCPGAICDNLTSYGGWWDNAKQTQLNEYLDAGAAGASGTVWEPYASANKFPSARLHVHYARGCTLAESFYQSVMWPFQLLIVGDPLCCPYGNFPQFKIKGLENSDPITDDFVLNVEQLPNSPPISHFELFYDGVFFGKIKNPHKIVVATNAVKDGYHELRIVGVSDSPIANRHVEKVGFVSQRQGHSLKLEIKNPICILGQTIQGSANASVGNKIQILQNSRKLATVESDREFVLQTSELGLGKSELQAASILPNGETIKSQPVVVSILALTKAQVDDRLQRPSKAELKKKVASIHDLLKDQYKNGTPEGHTELLKLLQKTANESVNKPVSHFALLSECIYAASEFNAVGAGWTACDQIESSYQLDKLPHIEFIKQIKTKLDQESASLLYSRGLDRYQQLIETDQFTKAGNLAKTLAVALKKPLPRAKPEIDGLIDRSKVLARKYIQIQDDLDILVDDPSNKPANGEVGEFYCLEKHDFKRGLSYLARGPVGPLQKLAQDEFLSNRATPQLRLEIADRWWGLAEEKKWETYKELAVKHYHDIVGDLEGLAKIRVEQRIQSWFPRGKTIKQLLTDHVWQVEWSGGSVWDTMKFLDDRVHVSGSGRSFVYEYQEIGGIAEIFNTDQKLFYKIILDGAKLNMVRLTSRNGTVKLTGVASRTKN